MSGRWLLRPLADRLPDGRIAVYVGGAYQYMTEAEATVLLQQLSAALAAEVTA